MALAQHDYGPLPVHFVGKTGTAVLLISIVGLMVADIDRPTAMQMRNTTMRVPQYTILESGLLTSRASLYNWSTGQ